MNTKRTVRERLKGVLSSAVFRLIAIVIAVVVPLNTLTLILVNIAISDAETQHSLEMQNAMAFYVSQIDNAMTQARTALNRLAVEDAEFSRLNLKEVNSDEEYYVQMQSVVHLKGELAKCLDANQLIDGTFSFFPQKDIFFIIGRYSTYSTEFQEILFRESQANGGTQSKSWKVIDLDGRECVL